MGDYEKLSDFTGVRACDPRRDVIFFT